MRPFKPAWLRGETSRQAHVGLPEGTFERELGREGFAGPATHMYHRRPPTGWTRFEGPLKPRAYDLNEAGAAPDPFAGQALLDNPSVAIKCWQTDSDMDHLVRNADGDWLLFVHRGNGALFCDYGHLDFDAGDYIVVPRGTMWRIAPQSTVWMLMIEARGAAFHLPDRGLLGQHALFDPAMLEVPEIDAEFVAQQTDDDWRVVVKRQNAVSTIDYPYNPLDAVGWTGDLAPVRINVRDIRPVMSHRYHLPPSAHATFVSERFMVSTFVPRPFETDADALKVPFFHNNDDYDEVIFYHAGDFFSRDNIDAGMMTFHPAGFTHGPHPRALEHMFEQSKPGTDEYAVMIDARDPLEPRASTFEVDGYASSWSSA